MEWISVQLLSLHPEAKRVPQMRPEEYATFLADVEERGVRTALEVQPGTTLILDGRSRWTAAKEAGIEKVPVIDAPLNGDDPVVYMLQAASLRRHLTDDQRGCLAEEEREWLAKKNKHERAKKAAKESSNKTTAKQAGLGDTVSPKPKTDKAKKARTQASKHHNVSERKTRSAGDVKKKDRKLFEKVKNGKMPLNKARREIQKRERQEQLEAQAKTAPTQATPPVLLCGDVLEQIQTIEDNTVGLIFADPPYNIGIDYGEGVKADRLPDQEFVSWCRSWLTECHRVLKDDGTLWLLINDEYADYLGVVLRDIGFHRRAWVKWYETFGVCNSAKKNFNRCSRHLFYCVKNAKKFTFNHEVVLRTSDRQTEYNDKRADPEGKVWDDVWEIPRVPGTSMERLPDFPTQLPLALLRAVVGCASNPGDLVLDPFSGSGTTGVAAVECGRKYIGIEKSKQFAEISELRLKGILSG